MSSKSPENDRLRASTGRFLVRATRAPSAGALTVGLTISRAAGYSRTLPTGPDRTVARSEQLPPAPPPPIQTHRPSGKALVAYKKPGRLARYDASAASLAKDVVMTPARAVRAASKAPAVPSKFLAEAQDRLAALPRGFTDWIDAAEPWPEGVPELLGPID